MFSVLRSAGRVTGERLAGRHELLRSVIVVGRRLSRAYRGTVVGFQWRNLWCTSVCSAWSSTSPHRLTVAIDPTLESSQVTRARSSPSHLPGPMSDGGSLWRNRVAGTGGASRIRCARRLALTAPKVHAGCTHDRPGRRRRTKPGMSPEPDDDVHHQKNDPDDEHQPTGAQTLDLIRPRGHEVAIRRVDCPHRAEMSCVLCSAARISLANLASHVIDHKRAPPHPPANRTVGATDLERI